MLCLCILIRKLKDTYNLNDVFLYLNIILSIIVWFRVLETDSAIVSNNNFKYKKGIS